MVVLLDSIDDCVRPFFRSPIRQLNDRNKISLILFRQEGHRNHRKQSDRDTDHNPAQRQRKGYVFQRETHACRVPNLDPLEQPIK
jgi:hypothetical protein